MQAAAQGQGLVLEGVEREVLGIAIAVARPARDDDIGQDEEDDERNERGGEERLSRQLACLCVVV